jgi:hypothetical protein
MSKEWGVYIRRGGLDPVCVKPHETKEAALIDAETRVGYMRDDHELIAADPETSTWALRHIGGSTAKVYVKKIGATS